MPSLSPVGTNFGSIGVQHRQCTYECNIEARLLNIFAVETNKNYIFCFCVCSFSYPSSNAHASYYIVICGLSGCTILSHIIS